MEHGAIEGPRNADYDETGSDTAQVVHSSAAILHGETSLKRDTGARRPKGELLAQGLEANGQSGTKKRCAAYTKEAVA